MTDATRRFVVCARRFIAGLAVLALMFVVPPSASAKGKGKGPRTRSKISKEIKKKLRKASPDDLLAVIVQTTNAPTSTHLSKVKKRGGHIKKKHSAIRGYSAKLKAKDIAALENDPDIETVSIDAPVSPFLEVAYKAVRADFASIDTGGLDGSGVGVAVIDTGVTNHPDLQAAPGSPQVIQVGPMGATETPGDPYGHGTHVAGIITGNGFASSDPLSFRTFGGLAPGVDLVAIRALSADGTGSTSDIIAAVDWAIENRDLYNIRILNLSLGHPVFESYETDPLCRAVRAATEAGIVVVVAAGNDGGIGSGFGTIASPANEPSVITVGAMDDYDTVALEDDIVDWYSSRGPTLVDFVAKPDLVAPGSWIVSTRSPGSYLDTNYHDLTLRIGDYKTDPANAGADGAYFSMAGTSMAAPMVAATAALMIQQDPALTPATVKARLMKSAVKDDRMVFESGAGFLDVQAVLLATGRAKSAMSPNVLAATNGGVYIEETALFWGRRWSLLEIYGAGKGSAAGISLSDVESSVTQAYGAIWGGRGGALSIIENNQLTDSGQLWTGEAFSILAADQTVDKLGAIWGGGGRR